MSETGNLKRFRVQAQVKSVPVFYDVVAESADTAENLVADALEQSGISAEILRRSVKEFHIDAVGIFKDTRLSHKGVFIVNSMEKPDTEVIR
ncbi:MAG: hypothetical protein Q4C70_01415 [Planctomycetia bacterium]|nr:hypothetical protein [Planctomycetia bacterium]